MNFPQSMVWGSISPSDQRIWRNFGDSCSPAGLRLASNYLPAASGCLPLPYSAVAGAAATE